MPFMTERLVKNKTIIREIQNFFYKNDTIRCNRLINNAKNFTSLVALRRISGSP